MSSWWSRLFGSARPSPVSPQVRHGRASSFHLWWELPTRVPLREVSATLEVLEPPAAGELYFWALQVSFAEGGQRLGGGHLGLQWNPRHPGHGAVNWGGYAAQSLGGDMLDGSVSELPSARGNRNTRDYPWQPGRAYRLRVYPAPGHVGAWRGEVVDLESGVATVVRDLYGGGAGLAAPVVWSEVFAPCEDPSVTVRWSALEAVTEDGEVLAARSVRVNYQRPEHGGCPNTDVLVDGTGTLQVTNVPRTTPQDAVLSLSRI